MKALSKSVLSILIIALSAECSRCATISAESGPKTWNIWDGSESTNWGDPLNWTAGVPNLSSRVKISSAAPHYPVVTSAVNCLDLEIETGAILTISNSAIVVGGQITNFGTINANTGTITMFGSGNGSISGTAVELNRFVINKLSISDTVFINTDVSIIDEMLFINGLVFSTVNEVIFLDESDSRDGSPASFIDGLVRKIGNNDFTFPVGDQGIYAPISIESFGLDTEEYSAQYHHQNPDSAGYNTDNFESSLVNISTCEYWILDHDVGTGATRVTLSCEDVRSCEVVEPWNLSVARWDGNTWVDHGSSGYEGDTESGIIKSVDAISNFSPFTLGSTSLANPLPVELLYFDAFLQNEIVVIEWATATETNCDYYLVERSSDLEKFTPVGVLQGAGNSTTTQNYELYDESPLSGFVYYRLKQFDYDGESTSYGPKSVKVETSYNLSVYPNPALDLIKITHNGFGSIVNISLYNSAGQRVLTRIYSDEQIELPIQMLASGHYILEVSSLKRVLREQIIVK
jgi:hypothetical protein